MEQQRARRQEVRLILCKPIFREERIFGRALARKVEVGRYSADTQNNPRQGRDEGFARQRTADPSPNLSQGEETTTPYS